MVVKQSDYEELLSWYSNHKQTLKLLKQYRPYLEFIPSMRRPAKSLISIPLPIVKIRKPIAVQPDQAVAPLSRSELVRVPCDLVLLMCDPDWKIKTGVEIFILIYRPEEDFSDLLGRWRNTQLLMDYDYEWLMPPQHRHMFGEGVGQGDIYPLFVIFPDTPARIQRGLQGAGLPFVVHQPLGDTDKSDTSDLDELSLNSYSAGGDFNYDLGETMSGTEDDVFPGEALS
ncbi:MAG: hypothetical protein NZ772_01940 [Cyanobacteria bacterium]|nr:hypothetical protein [Cyanobacteriota bacterium]MDW8200205.1 hypothetical protein [Cyanobacteriota bacterium SKYGB_h_bin112]